MAVERDITWNIRHFQGALRCDRNFDVVYRVFRICGREACMFFVDGFAKDELLEKVMQFLFSVKPEDLAPLRAYRITDPVPQVTTPEPYTLRPEGDVLHRVALIDYGAKRNIARELCKRGCAVTVLPCSATAEDILAAGYDGVMLSNGPGDPTDNVDQIAQIAKLFGRIPMFGICLGHQLMALAQGGSTVKLKYGHRGVNQPARDVCGTRTFLTSQNHGYAVVPESVKTGVIRYVNANDGTCEGIDYPDLQAFSVQFHPEACSGPHDTAFLFDRFCDLMGGAHHAD